MILASSSSRSEPCRGGGILEEFLARAEVVDSGAPLKVYSVLE